jgi:uncharacterized protein
MSQPGEVTFAVRVRPGASRTVVGGGYPGPYGAALIVTVSAPAVDGRATEAALRATAAALGVDRRALRLRRGESSRDKLFLLADPPADFAARLAGLRGEPAAPTSAGEGSA